MKKTLGIILGGLMVLGLSTSWAAAASTEGAEAAVKTPAPYCQGYKGDKANGGAGYCNGQGRGHGRFRNADGTCRNPNCPNYKADSQTAK